MTSLMKIFTPLVFVVIGASSFEARAMHTFKGLDLRNGSETSIVREDAAFKGTVLVFLSSKCPCSASHMVEIKDLAKDYPMFRFIGVNSNSDETLESAKAFFAAQGFPFPILRDEKAQIADEFRAVKTPHAFILAFDGKKLFQGGVSNSATFPRADRKYLREALEDIKGDQPVRTPLARALGCTISRGD
jgi:peroxiredoxin